MGRIFEVLQQTEAGEKRLSVVRQDAAEVEAQAPNDRDDTEETSALPFIEVGPRKSIEASPGLLDAAPPRPPSRVVADEGPVLAASSEPSLPIHTAPSFRPMSVAFRPRTTLPDMPLPMRPTVAPELVAYHRPEHPASVRYQALLSKLATVQPDREPAFFFTSAMLGARTTTVLLNLAITAARDNKRVVVVDANCRRPGIAAKLGLADQPGLREVLNGTVSLDDALQETEQINLFALATGSRRPDSGLRMVAGTVRTLVRDLRRQFQLVLMDGPRWESRPDVLAAAAACDAVFVVMPESEAESSQVDQVVQAIPEQGARFGGCILTSAEIGDAAA